MIGLIRAWLYRFWHGVEPPRALSAIYFFAYLAVAVMGLAVELDPPRSVQGSIGAELVTFWAALLLVGGSIGAATVLRGVWWLERTGAILCGFAMAIYGVAVTGMPVTQPSLRIATLSFVAFSILAFAARLVNIRQYAYDPEK